MSIMSVEVECPACNATGIYVGLAERDGHGVVCHKCKGTGCVTIQYQPFTGRHSRTDVVQVLEKNPGIIAGRGGHGEYAIGDFGGMTYDEWAHGKPFTRGMEMRRFVCPNWHYHSSRPLKRCDSCMAGCSFSDCEHFPDKAECWRQFDKLHPAESAPK